MPEGPSIVILKELLRPFKGREVLRASGSTKTFALDMLNNQTLTDVKSWGKHLLLCFRPFTIRIHLLMFGTYRVNETKAATPRLALHFADGMVNFYSCAIQVIDQPLNNVYDWEADVLNKRWNSRKALKKLRAQPDTWVCDALLDQSIFAGVGNIIKMEVLFRIRVHPLSQVGKLPPAKLRAMVKEAVHYSHQFLEWKKAFVLKQHWLIIGKKKCPREHASVQKKYLGKTNRRTFFCPVCQRLYN